jgi:hypothetical protein
MGWFAVLQPDAVESSGTVSIPRCHINFWALPGLWPGRRLFYFDLGLEVTAKSTAVSTIGLVLPFEAEKHTWHRGRRQFVLDLHDQVVRSEIAELIFGGPVGLSSEGQQHRITMADQDDFLPARLKASSVELRQHDLTPRADLSVWKVPLLQEVPPGETRYIRTRWSVYRPGTLWEWKYSGLARSGAQVDLRIADARESENVDAERGLWHHVAPIETLNVFFIAPPKFRPRVASPALHYIRTLEAGAWRDYLTGAAWRGRTTGLLVNYWRYPSSSGQTAPLVAEVDDSAETRRADSSQIDIDNPFRAFLDLSRDTAAPPWLLSLRTIVSVLLAFAMLEAWRESRDQVRWVEQWLQEIRPWQIITFVLGAALIPMLTSAAKVWSWISDRGRKTRLVVRRVEHWLLSKLGASRS